MTENNQPGQQDASQINRRRFLNKSNLILFGSVTGVTLAGNVMVSIAFREPLSKEKIDEIDRGLAEALGVTSRHADDLPDRPEINKNLQAMAKKAGLEPVQLYVYDDPDINAFCMPIASLALSEYGNRASISSELLKILNDQEVTAVLGHELGHMIHKKKDVIRMMAPSAIPQMSGFLTGAAVGVTAVLAADKYLPKNVIRMKGVKKEFYRGEKF